MSTAPLAIFCTTSEGLDFTNRLGDKLALPIIYFSFKPNDGYSCITKEEIKEGSQLRVFILNEKPPTEQSFNEFVEANADSIAIDIKIGGVLSDPPTLLLSTFETGKKSNAAAQAAIAWLKRQVRTEVNFGVVGGDQPTGVGRTYSRMGYTKGAMLLHSAGVLWRSGRNHLSTFWPPTE